MNRCIYGLDTNYFPVLLKKLLRSLSEFLSHLYSVALPYLQFHYFNSPFNQKFNCKYIFQMHLVDLSKTHEQLVLSVNYTLMIKPASKSQKMIPGQGSQTLRGRSMQNLPREYLVLSVRNGNFCKEVMLLSTYIMRVKFVLFFFLISGLQKPSDT